MAAMTSIYTLKHCHSTPIMTCWLVNNPNEAAVVEFVLTNAQLETGETALEWLMALRDAGAMTFLKSASPAETSRALVPVFCGHKPHFQNKVPARASNLDTAFH